MTSRPQTPYDPSIGTPLNQNSLAPEASHRPSLPAKPSNNQIESSAAPSCNECAATIV